MQSQARVCYVEYVIEEVCLMANGKILCSLSQETCIIKMVGRIQYHISLDLGVLIKKMATKPPVNCLIDLTEATYMDSTSLGVIAGIKALEYRHDIKISSRIYSTNQTVTDIVKGVGFHSIFDIVEASPEYTIFEINELPSEKIAKDDTREIFLGAHKDLSSINEKNRVTFLDVVQLLESESPIDQFEDFIAS